MSRIVARSALVAALWAAPGGDALAGSGASRSTATTTRAVEGGSEAPGAWAVLERGGIWVCWSDAEASGNCWRRVPFELAHAEALLDPGETSSGFDPAPSTRAWQMGFDRHGRLIIRDPGRRYWAVDEGRTQPRPLPGGEGARLATPRPIACSNTGRAPHFLGRVRDFARVPTCGTTRRSAKMPLACASLQRASTQTRMPTMWRLGLTVQWTRRVGWSTTAAQMQRAGLLHRYGDDEVALFINVGIDLAARRRALATIRALERRRPPPAPVIDAGPLGDAETAALTAILCPRNNSGQSPWSR